MLEMELSQRDFCRRHSVELSNTTGSGDFSRSKENSPTVERLTFQDLNLKYLAIGSLVVQIQKSYKVPNIWAPNIQVPHVVNPTSFPSFSKLLRARWIRAEFKQHGIFDDRMSIRVFILPDDVGRSKISREDLSLRKSMWELISGLDKSVAGWDGNGSIDQPKTTYENPNSKDKSLLHMFNTLQDPKPKPKSVSDEFSRDAMEALLEPSEGIQGLRSQLFDYQRRSAAMMIQREVQPAKLLDPRFERRVGPTGEVFYLDERAGCLLGDKREYDGARGGILAETMGIGKTLICLVLILTTKGHWPKVPPEYSVGLHPIRSKVGRLMEMAAATVARHQIPWKAYFEDQGREGQHYKRCVEALQSQVGYYLLPPKVSRVHRFSKPMASAAIKLCSATLIVVPANLLAQWKQEIFLHIDAGFLSVLIIEDLSTTMPSSSRLLDYDIILMERKRFERESMSKENSGNSPFAAATQDEPGNRHTDFDHCESKVACGMKNALAGCRCSYTKHPHSPLICLHFLRLIVDEGHNFAASGMNSNSAISMQKLRVERRWIVSGTPANGLLGAEVDLAASEAPRIPTPFHANTCRVQDKPSSALAQETKDLKSLGNIVVNFLALPPWSNLKTSPDYVSWDWYLVPPRGSGQRNSQTLRKVLTSLIVRHRIETVKVEIQLPELYNRVIYLRPCYFDKLSINLFLLKLASNAVTSERVDKDYMFHPSNRKQLDLLIANLRKSGFFWTGFTAEDVQDTVQLSRRYIETKGADLSKEDTCLIDNAIGAGLNSLKSALWHALSKLDEIGLCINGFPAEACENWSLTRTKESSHCIIGATQLDRAVRFIDDRLHLSNPAEGLPHAGQVEMQKVDKVATKQSKLKAKSPFAGISPQKIKAKATRIQNSIPQTAVGKKVRKMNHPLSDNEAARNHALESHKDGEDVARCPGSVLKPAKTSARLLLPTSSPLSRTELIGTVSAKLSYLLDRVISLHKEEKILIFYEGDHIAYYIAQALELIGVEYLIYANSLEVARRNEYMLTFTTTETFRVMLMDLRQAAHGLHVACASRVFFVNPVWQPNIEAQAVKRAHRIGQTRPVFVETLVLENTLEDQMLQRRKAMTAREQQEASKSLLDDSTMSGIIKDAQFIPLLDQELEDEKFQFAPLKFPQQIFGRKAGTSGLLASHMAPVTSQSAKTDMACQDPGKKRVIFATSGDEDDDASSSLPSEGKLGLKRRKLGAT